MSDDFTKKSIELAEAHVAWYLKSIRPLLVDHMVHGFKHGVEHERARPGKERLEPHDHHLEFEKRMKEYLPDQS